MLSGHSGLWQKGRASLLQTLACSAPSVGSLGGRGRPAPPRERGLQRRGRFLLGHPRRFVSRVQVWGRACQGHRGRRSRPPAPLVPALRGSDLPGRADHDLGHEVDDGAGGLLRVVLGEQVAGVVCGAALLPGHEPEDSAKGRGVRAPAAPGPEPRPRPAPAARARTLGHLPPAPGVREGAGHPARVWDLSHSCSSRPGQSPKTPARAGRQARTPGCSWALTGKCRETDCGADATAAAPGACRLDADSPAPGRGGGREGAGGVGGGAGSLLGSVCVPTAGCHGSARNCGTRYFP